MQRISPRLPGEVETTLKNHDTMVRWYLDIKVRYDDYPIKNKQG